MSEEKQLVIYDHNKAISKDVQRALPADVEAILNLVRQDDIAISLRNIEQSLSRRQIQGHKVTVILQVTDQLQWRDLLKTEPFVPWARASFVNYGPAPVYIAVNDYYDFTRVVQWAELPFDYTEADQRITYIGYKCDLGAAASIQVVATY